MDELPQSACPKLFNRAVRQMSSDHAAVPAAKLDRLVSRWQAIQGELNSRVEQQRFVRRIRSLRF